MRATYVFAAIGVVLIATGAFLVQKVRSTTLSSREAATIGGALPQAIFHPIYEEAHMCSEHSYDPDWALGDALGQDCLITDGVDFSDNSGFMHLYANDGSRNEDWYGWDEPVLAPLSGKIVSIHRNETVNIPGSMAPGKATTVMIEAKSGDQALLAHLGQVLVKQGDEVAAGDQVGTVGNNGFARNPHIHVGAITASGEAAQIRWNLGSAAVVRRGALQDFRDLID